MRGWIKKALTRTLTVKGPRGKMEKKIEVEPSSRLVYAMTFSVYALLSLVALQIAHLIVLREWNSEIFAATTGLIGTISGILIAQRS